MSDRKSNKELYPEAWNFFIEHARNMEEEEESKYGKYRIPAPNMSGNFIYADDPALLWIRFKEEFYKPRLNSHSVYGKIQYIVEHFNS